MRLPSAVIRKSTSDFCEIIEIYFPTLPKVDLHARDVIPRPGWYVWGLEEPTSARDPHAVDHRRLGLMKHGPCSRYVGHGGAVGQ